MTLHPPAWIAALTVADLWTVIPAGVLLAGIGVIFGAGKARGKNDEWMRQADQHFTEIQTTLSVGFARWDERFEEHASDDKEMFEALTSSMRSIGAVVRESFILKHGRLPRADTDDPESRL